MTKPTLQDVVKSRRAELRLSREALARACGDLSTRVIARIERGETKNPHGLTLQALSKGLRLSVERLVASQEP